MTNAELFTSKPLKPETVAIIGGGIAAVTLAHHIFQIAPETNVTIFCEDDELASRGSGNKQGAIYPLLQGSKSVIAEFYATCFDYAMDYYAGELNSGLDVEHGFTGVLQQAIKPELEARLKKVAEAWPHQCEYLTVQESSKIANIELPYPSIYFKNAGWIWPQQFCQQLALKLQQDFALTIELGAHISKLEQDEKWHLYKQDQPISQQFGAVVVSTGHQSNTFEQSAHIPLQSVRGQVSRFHANTQLAELKTVLCHKGYITPAQSQYQCFGATFMKDDDNESVRLSEQEANVNQLKTVYQQQDWAHTFDDSDVIANTAAIRAMSPDHIPIIGELFSNDWIKANVDKNTGRMKRLRAPNSSHPNSDISGLFVYTGLGARGLTSAPLLSKHLANSMFGLGKPFNERLQKAINSKRFQVRELKKNKGIKD